MTLNDRNHNENNLRYRSILGGKSMKTIRNILINIGMIKQSGIKQDMWQV